ncbi:MAG: hypothetical protein IPM95_14710 [Sphingobacteriales bacterium]|nr:hypothetical protein [Sphingobacteriales bacterium]
MNIYILVQFAFIIIGLSAYLYHFEKLSVFFRVLAFAVLMLSTIICSAILEQKQWVKYAEYFRLLLAIAGLNSLYYISFNNWFYIVLVISILITAYFLVWYTLNIHNRHLLKTMAVKISYFSTAFLILLLYFYKHGTSCVLELKNIFNHH